MNADEPIGDCERGWRSVRIIQDVNGHFYVGHFYVEGNGGQGDEAFHRATKSDALMRAEGYRPVTEVYPGLQERPRSPVGVALDDLYLSVSTPPADPPGLYPLWRDSARSG